MRFEAFHRPFSNVRRAACAMVPPSFTSYKKPIIAVILVTVFVVSAVIVLGTPTGMEDVKVAIYDGGGTLESSKIAIDNMFAWMRARINHVNASQIREGALADYDILVMPAGGGFGEYLQNEGVHAIRQFVEDGGSYFGICGGAAFATDAGLSLYNGTYHPAIDGYGEFMMEMNVNRSSTGPDLSEEPESYSVFYLPCMIAFKYGAGTVFLSSPHPEYEEGNNRDGVTYFDALGDPDSEWGLLLKVCQWLVQESE